MRGAVGYAVMLVAALMIESALLRAGAGLQTAPAVGGRWDLRAAGAKRVPVAIVQTGPYLDVALPDALRLRGRIDGERITADGEGVALAGSLANGTITGTIRCGVRRLCHRFESARSAPPAHSKAAAEPPDSIRFHAERLP